MLMQERHLPFQRLPVFPTFRRLSFIFNYSLRIFSFLSKTSVQFALHMSTQLYVNVSVLESIHTAIQRGVDLRCFELLIRL